TVPATRSWEQVPVTSRSSNLRVAASKVIHQAIQVLKGTLKALPMRAVVFRTVSHTVMVQAPVVPVPLMETCCPPPVKLAMEKPVPLATATNPGVCQTMKHDMPPLPAIGGLDHTILWPTGESVVMR